MLSIGIGSKTSTGGAVLEGNPGVICNDLVASSVGHMASCPKCKKGIGPIVAVGPRAAVLPAGPAARAGDYVACGCPPGSNVLLAEGVVSVGSGSQYDGASSGVPSSPSEGNNERSGPFSGRFQLIDQETGKPVAGRKVKVWSSGGWAAFDTTDAEGMTSWVNRDTSETLHIDLVQGGGA